MEGIVVLGRRMSDTAITKGMSDPAFVEFHVVGVCGCVCVGTPMYTY